MATSKAKSRKTSVEIRSSSSSVQAHRGSSSSKTYLVLASALVGILSLLAATTEGGTSFVSSSREHITRVLQDFGQSFSSAAVPKEECNVDSILSTHKVLGFHPVCVTLSAADKLDVVAYVNGRNDTRHFTVPASYAELRSKLEDVLQLEHLPPGSEPPSKYPWQAFSADGTVQISSLAEAAPADVGSSRLLYVFKGGVFIWPGVAVGHVQTVTGLQGIGSIDMTTLSMEPLVFGMQHFLTQSECDYIQNRSAPHLTASPVSLMDHDKGKADTEWRTSTTYFMSSTGDVALELIDERVAGLTRQPVNQQEAAQVGYNLSSLCFVYFNKKWLTTCCV
jgi:prolyl 4-hydroxylase